MSATDANDWPECLVHIDLGRLPELERSKDAWFALTISTSLSTDSNGVQAYSGLLAPWTWDGELKVRLYVEDGGAVQSIGSGYLASTFLYFARWQGAQRQ